MSGYSVSAVDNEVNAWKAFDKDSSTSWSTSYSNGGNQAITFDFGGPVSVKGVRFTPSATNPVAFPATIVVRARNDSDDDYDPLNSLTTVTPMSGVPQPLTINVPDNYRYYQFVVSGTHETPTPSTINISIAEIEFLVSKDVLIPEPTLQQKTANPTTTQQVIAPDPGYDGLSKVTVEGIPSVYKDTSDATASASDIVSGKTAYINGEKVTGTAVPTADPKLQEKSVTPSTSQQIITPDTSYDGLSKVTVGAIPSGYVSTTDATATASDIKSGITAYVKGSKITGSMSTVVVPTPSISISSSGLITASNSQSAGYTAGGSKSATNQLTTKAGATITPGTTNKTIASGTYLTGVQTISGDSNLIAANIKKDVSIFGVTGTYEPSTGSAGTANFPLYEVKFNLTSAVTSGKPIWVLGTSGEKNANGNYHFFTQLQQNTPYVTTIPTTGYIIIMNHCGKALTIQCPINWKYISDTTSGGSMGTGNPNSNANDSGVTFATSEKLIVLNIDTTYTPESVTFTFSY